MDRYQEDISEDRRGDIERRTYTGIDIRKTSLKTDGETEWRIYTGIDIRKTSLKTDGETQGGEPTRG